jgi:hypothetical protein
MQSLDITPSLFPRIELSLVLNKPVFIILWVIFFVGYAAVTSILIYHWSTYGMHNTKVITSETLFTTVSVVLFVVAGLAISYF